MAVCFHSDKGPQEPLETLVDVYSNMFAAVRRVEVGSNAEPRRNSRHPHCVSLLPERRNAGDRQVLVIRQPIVNKAVGRLWNGSGAAVGRQWKHLLAAAFPIRFLWLTPPLGSHCSSAMFTGPSKPSSSRIQRARRAASRGPTFPGTLPARSFRSCARAILRWSATETAGPFVPSQGRFNQLKVLRP